MMRTACKVGRLGKNVGALLFAFLTSGLLVSSLRAQSLPSRLGDLDADGQPTVLDLVRLINHLNYSQLSTPQLSTNLLPFADLNGDALINRTDVDLLADLILGLPLPSRPVTFEPANGSSEVGVTVRPRAVFPRPINTATLNSNNFYASFAGRKLPARIVPAANGTGWLEIFNPGNVAVSLSGRRLTYRDNLGGLFTHDFTVNPPSVNANGFLQLLANGNLSGGQNLGFQTVPQGNHLDLRTGTFGSTINDWCYEAFGDPNTTSIGRPWDGGPSGRRDRAVLTEQIDRACPFENATTIPSTPGAASAVEPLGVNKLISAAQADWLIVVRWSRLNSLPSVFSYSPKQYDGFPINIEGIAFRSNMEMIVGLRSPLSQTRGTGNTPYYRVNNVGAFLPPAGWPMNQVPAGVAGPQFINLGGQGVRDIAWFDDLDPGPGTVARYLIVGGSPNGGPLEKERVGEKFSLWSWNGNAASAPIRVIDDLRPYTVRPEGITVIQASGQPSRILFVEDRFQAVGYGTRNAIHWPMSILGNLNNL